MEGQGHKGRGGAGRGGGGGTAAPPRGRRFWLRTPKTGLSTRERRRAGPPAQLGERRPASGPPQMKGAHKARSRPGRGSAARDGGSLAKTVLRLVVRGPLSAVGSAHPNLSHPVDPGRPPGLAARLGEFPAACCPFSRPPARVVSMGACQDGIHL